MKKLIALLLVSLSMALPVQADDGIKVVYHLSEGLEQARNGLRNVSNHLSIDPKAKVVVVSHALGVDFMMEGAKDKAGNPFDVTVQELIAQGVVFRVC